MNNSMRKIKTKFQHLCMAFCGRRNLKTIIKKHPGKVLILTDRGVGDQVFMLAYLKKWASYHQVDNWAVLAINTKQALYKLFLIDESRLIKITAEKVEQINFFCSSIYGKLFRRRYPEVLDNREWWETIISGEYQNYYEKMYGNR